MAEAVQLKNLHGLVVMRFVGQRLKMQSVNLIVTSTYRKRPEFARLHRVLIPHMDWVLQPGVLLLVRGGGREGREELVHQLRNNSEIKLNGTGKAVLFK